MALARNSHVITRRTFASGFFAGSWKCLGNWPNLCVTSFYDVYYVK